MLMIGIVVVVIIVFVFGGWYIAFTRFGVGPAFPFLLTANAEMERVSEMQLEDNPLMATVDSKEAAEEVAELYGITLVSCENGVAVYQTEEEPMQVIARGQENGYPQLSLNFKRELHDDMDRKLLDVQSIEYQLMEEE